MWRYFALLLPFFAFNGIFPFVAGLVPGYYGWVAFGVDSALREQGDLVEAHITNRAKSGSGFHINYSFIDTGGVEYKFDRIFSSEFNEMVNGKDYFLVTYLPSDPKIHIIGDKSATSLSSTLAFGLLGAAVVLCGWGAWGIGSTLWQLAKVHDLFKNGKVGTATVGNWIKSPRRARQRKDEMTFHFVAANGRWYEGRSRPFNRYYQSKWPKGSHIKIAYDAITPTRCEPDIFKLLG